MRGYTFRYWFIEKICKTLAVGSELDFSSFGGITLFHDAVLRFRSLISTSLFLSITRPSHDYLLKYLNTYLGVHVQV